MHRLLLVLCLLQTGCINFRWEDQRVGTPEPVEKANALQVGKTTLAETLARLGPPDLLLKRTDVNRAYYTYWESDYFKLVVRISVPAVRNISVDVFSMTWGDEELHYARLDFDRNGILVEMHIDKLIYDHNSQAYAVDNAVVGNFLENKARALEALETQEEDDEEE